ncbi:MAG: hypothetical protein Q4E24_05660 [bacterium]|nr:hypothetical protein [bacterium]
MDVSYMIEGILCLYIAFAGIALTAYFLSLCHEEWRKRSKVKSLRKAEKRKIENIKAENVKAENVKAGQIRFGGLKIWNTFNKSLGA